MKDKIFITIKLFKKHTIPLMLLLVAMVLFFINIFYVPKVYAQEQIAKVEYSVNVIDDENVNNLAFNQLVVANNETSNINLSDINANLNKNSYIEIQMVVENIFEENVKLTLSLNKLKLKNFIVNFYVDGKESSSLEHLLNAKENVEIKVFLKIENVAQDASLCGNLRLNISQVG